MEGLPGKKEHLGTFFASHASPEDGQHLSQGPSGEVNCDISIPRLRYAYSQVNNPAPCKAETRAIDGTR